MLEEHKEIRVKIFSIDPNGHVKVVELTDHRSTIHPSLLLYIVNNSELHYKLQMRCDKLLYKKTQNWGTFETERARLFFSPFFPSFLKTEAVTL